MTPRIQASWLTRAETQAVFAALASAGHEARAVGGAVRNALIGKAASDVDIATPALPEQTQAAAKAAGLQVVLTGLQHGTVTVMSGGVPYEVTTLRRDVETDGRHAVVAYTDDWAADAARRDLTINALYCAADGTLHDPLDGYPDIVARRVRFIGDACQRIREDYLRILRFFRFTAEYAEGPVDAVGLAACGALRDGLQRLSAERCRTEILKLLVAPRAAEVAQIMFAHGYWPALLGTVPWITHLERAIAQDHNTGAQADHMQRLATLAINTPEDAAHLSRRLRLSRQQGATLDVIARLVPALAASPSEHEVRKLRHEFGREHCLAACAVARARYGGDWQRLTHLITTTSIPDFPLRGQDLLDRGLMPGPETGKALAKLKALWIASDFALTRAHLLDHWEASR